MGIKERKERERDERRELILNAATEIMAAEGLDNLSIRKIANKIEYSPAIIYHYFQDKDDIVNHILKRGYQKILGALSSNPGIPQEPEEKLKNLMRQYITAALQMPDEYKTVQLSSTPGVLEFTSSLFAGAAGKKPALNILFQCLKEIYCDRDVDDTSLELTAQVISSATFGLIIKLILEKDFITTQQREVLIEHYIKLIVKGMVLGTPLNNL